jgi:hypothetical protein
MKFLPDWMRSKQSKHNEETRMKLKILRAAIIDGTSQIQEAINERNNNKASD